MMRLLTALAAALMLLAAPTGAAGASRTPAPGVRTEAQKKTPAKKNKKGTPAKGKKTPAKKKRKEAPKPPAADEVRREQKRTTEQIRRTTEQLDANRRSTAEQVTRLGDLRRRIADQSKVIELTRRDTETLEKRIAGTADTIAALQADIDRMRRAYADLLHRSQGVETMTDKLTFLLSARSFSEAAARVRYLRQVGRSRAHRAEELRRAAARLDNRQAEMAAMLQRKQQHLQVMHNARARVEQDTRSTEQLVSDLRKRGNELEALLARQRKRLADLDTELDRLIAAEAARKAEQERARRSAAQASAKKGAKGKKGPAAAPGSDDRTAAPPDERLAYAGSSLTALKGRLPFPVEGRYRIISTFGRHPHPDVPAVEVDNPGIDIQLLGDGHARAIASGTVSAIFRQNGYENIVMVRHGSHIAIYAGLASLSVQKGQSVKAGQRIGSVRADDDQGGRRVLHFELRHERQKLNPLAWVKR